MQFWEKYFFFFYFFTCSFTYFNYANTMEIIMRFIKARCDPVFIGTQCTFTRFYFDKYWVKMYKETCKS